MTNALDLFFFFFGTLKTGTSGTPALYVDLQARGSPTRKTSQSKGK